jgi:peroxiredoxin
MPRGSASFAVVLATAFSFTCASAGQAPVQAPSIPSPAPVYTVGAMSGYAVVDMGSQAPDFSFESAQGWAQLKDVRAQGNVLLAFCPTDAQLSALESERVRLFTMGIVPVAVLDRRPSVCRLTAKRLGLSYLIVPDTRHVIGAQFNALDPATGAVAPAWFVIDRKGCVRGMAHEAWPARSWTNVCAEALGLPSPDAARSASHE